MSTLSKKQLQPRVESQQNCCHSAVEPCDRCCSRCKCALKQRLLITPQWSSLCKRCQVQTGMICFQMKGKYSRTTSGRTGTQLLLRGQSGAVTLTVRTPDAPKLVSIPTRRRSSNTKSRNRSSESTHSLTSAPPKSAGNTDECAGGNVL